MSDFEFEFQMALMNRKLNDNFETIFMMPKDTYTFLSSRLVKEIARLHRMGVGAGFGVGSGADAKDSSMVIAEIGQGGITLPGGVGRGADIQSLVERGG
mgnify:CR=1 FL=1